MTLGLALHVELHVAAQAAVVGILVVEGAEVGRGFLAVLQVVVAAGFGALLETWF